MVSYTAQGRVQEMLTKTPVRLRPRAAADQKATARARTGSAPLFNLNGENSNACVLSSWVAAVAPQPLGDALDVEWIGDDWSEIRCRASVLRPVRMLSNAATAAQGAVRPLPALQTPPCL